MPEPPPAKKPPDGPIGVREAGGRDEPNPALRWLRILGPGIIVGASDDDPSGIGTYAVAGASLGFSTLWTALITLPMMVAVQFIAAKIGIVSGLGLTSLLRRHYPRWLAVSLAFALVAANTVNAGADIGAIAAAINLLLPHVPIAALVIPVGVTLLLLLIVGSYRLIARTFKWLALALLAYVAAAFFAHPDWLAVLRGTFVPTIRFDASHLTTLVAILGTTISPYMIIWQARQEVEEDIAFGRRFLWQRRGTTPTELRYAAADVAVGMLLSNIVMYFIILTTAATLHASGNRHIETAADAAKALVPLAGRGAEALLAMGMIGAGALAVPILTGSAAYALAGAFNLKAGLAEQPSRAPQFYAAIAASTLVGMEINFVGIGAVAALFWSAVINGVLAPVLLAVMMLVANNHKIMGSDRNGPLLNLAGWATTGAMALAAAGLFVFWGK